MECFTNRLDLFHIYNWERDHKKKRFGKGRTLKQNLEGDWISHLCVTFKVQQFLLPAQHKSCYAQTWLKTIQIWAFKDGCAKSQQPSCLPCLVMLTVQTVSKPSERRSSRISDHAAFATYQVPTGRPKFSRSRRSSHLMEQIAATNIKTLGERMMQARPLEPGYSPPSRPRAWCNVGDPRSQARAHRNETEDTIKR